jgi:hypothetical protein
MVGVAAAVALLGALMLAIPPHPAQDVSAPAATAPEMGEITRYTGTDELLGLDSEGTAVAYPWGTAQEGQQVTSRLMMSDPRVSGLRSCFSNAYQVGIGGMGWLRTFDCRTFDEDGAATWHAVGQGYMDSAATGMHHYARLVGEGVNEGLFAVERCDAARYYDETFECEGAIYEGGLPPAPEGPPAQLPPGYLE